MISLEILKVCESARALEVEGGHPVRSVVAMCVRAWLWETLRSALVLAQWMSCTNGSSSSFGSARPAFRLPIHILLLPRVLLPSLSLWHRLSAAVAARLCSGSCAVLLCADPFSLHLVHL